MTMVFVAPIAAAQEAAPEAAPGTPDGTVEKDLRPRPWSLEIEPTLWYAALGGDVTIAGGTSASVETLDIDDPNASPAGELHWRQEKLTFTFFGAAVGVDESTTSRGAFTAGPVVVAPGQPISTDLDFMTFHALVGYEVWSWPPSAPKEGWTGPLFDDSNVTMRLDVYGGARLNYMDTKVSSGGVSASGEGWFPQPVVGLRLELELTKSFSADLCFDAGWWPGDSMGSTTVSVMVGFQWRPWEHVGFQIGFRQMFMDLKDEGDLEYDGSLGGLMGAVVLRF